MQTYIDYGPRRADAPRASDVLIRPLEKLCGVTLEPGVRILDIGCGNGFYAGWFASYGCSVVGIDDSPERIGIARRAYKRARFEVDQVDDRLLERLGEESFDVVISTGAMAEVADHRRFVRGCYAALRQGGRFIGTTPFEGHVRSVARSISGGFQRHQPDLLEGGRVRSWTRRPLTQLLHEAGFVNVRFRGAGRLPLLWSTMLVSADRPMDSLLGWGTSPISA
jgi:SAM-dependent methyltransferase